VVVVGVVVVVVLVGRTKVGGDAVVAGAAALASRMALRIPIDANLAANPRKRHLTAPRPLDPLGIAFNIRMDEFDSADSRLVCVTLCEPILVRLRASCAACKHRH